MKRLIFPVISFVFLVTNISAQKQVRIKDNFDFDWKFTLNDQKEYSKATRNHRDWKDIQLPHDWNISQEFDRNAGGSAGFLPGGTGWYLKTFTLPKSYKDKSISVLFDGIFHQSDVYINGHHLGFRPYGFCSIEYDLTPYLSFDGENTLAVRVDCTGERARWYAGAGIYRHA